MQARRNLSSWRKITVLDENCQPATEFNLTELGKLETKFPKSRPRNLHYALSNINKPNSMENQNQTSIQIQQELPTMLPVTLPTTPTTPEVVSEQFCFIDVPDFVVDDYFAFDLSDPTEFSFDEESQEFPYSY